MKGDDCPLLYFYIQNYHIIYASFASSDTKIWQGDKCHFSHNTVHFTKSKSCSFFARHSCMKGDDCPFDHQLSKYPCVSSVSGGGDACLFCTVTSQRKFCYAFKDSQTRNEISTLFRKHKFQHASYKTI
ncbi:hypothetical protein HN51_027477 [Arachis hypogaea]